MNIYLFVSCRPKFNNGHTYNHYIISNYGRIVNLHNNMRGNIQLYTDQKYDIILNKEYYRILTSLKLYNYSGNNNYTFNNQEYNQIMDIYKQYHPKATEIFTIEQKTLKLKDKENEIKKLEDNYLKNMKNYLIKKMS